MKLLKIRARNLRKNSTDAEARIWYHIRNRSLHGYKFHRQYVIGKYIVDFVCRDQYLIVELDGGQHAEQENYDERRSQFLNNVGYRILRFWNNDVLQNTDGVLESIVEELKNPHPSPLPKGRGDKNSGTSNL